MGGEGLRGHLDLLLLEVLSRSPGHGYAVMAALRDGSGGVLDVTEGAIYPALHRLESQGHIVGDWQPVAGRRRRVYTITPAGRGALERRRREWRALSAAIEGVLGAPARTARASRRPRAAGAGA